MGGFRKLGEELIHHGWVIDLYRERFEAPDGTIMERDVVRHPGAVSVVPVLDDGTVVLVRQFRAPLGREMLEIPAGKLDVEGEDLEAAARRELAEEVGFEAGSLELLVRRGCRVASSWESAPIRLGDLHSAPGTGLTRP